MKTIRLSQSKVAFVDDEDFDWLNSYKWTYASGYAIRSEGPSFRRRYIYMHSQIMGYPDLVDHKNRNGLDNRRENLRIASRSLNQFNKVPKQRDLPRGVFKNHKRFMAKMNIEGKQTYLGTYDTPEEASCAYREKAFQLFGEYPIEWNG